MSENVKKQSGYVKKPDEAFDENPWRRDLAYTMKRGSKIVSMGRSKKLIDINTGEVQDQDVAMVTKRVVDQDEFIKIFEGGISHLFSLSKTAQELFQVVLTIYLDGKFSGERIYLSPKSLSDAGYTRTRATMTNGLNQLLEKRFLARVKDEKHLFWVNPNMFFKGDRMRLIQDFAIEGTPAAKQLEEEADALLQATQQGSLDFSPPDES